MLGTELTGDLRCARCRYNLRGLSVRGVCPECGTPVAATLLTVIDPQATELQPVRRPYLISAGMVVWAVGALGAATLAWVVRLAEAFSALGPVAWVPGWISICLAVCGVGGLALVRPHGRIPRSSRWAAMAACVGCWALAWTTWKILGEIDGPGARPYLSGTEWSSRWAWKLVETALIGAVVLGFRPVFHVLQARSHLMRSGRMERQTLRALLASTVVIMCGDLVQAAIRELQPSWAEIATNGAICVTGVGSLLLTAGLFGVGMDVRRLLPVIIEPPLSLNDVLGSAPAEVPQGAGADYRGRSTPATEAPR